MDGGACKRRQAILQSEAIHGWFSHVLREGILCWDHEKFIADFESSTCYHPPLKLVDGKAGTLLETTFEWKGDKFSYKLKNDNVIGKEPTIYGDTKTSDHTHRV